MKHNCDLCSADDPRPIEAARPYIGDNDPPCVCGNCGFVYVVERRSPEEVAAAWNDLWGPDSYTSAWPAVKARLTYVAEWIDQNTGLEGKSVLDIGAGEGTFLEMVRDRGAVPFGIEPSEDNIRRMSKNGLDGICATVEVAADYLSGAHAQYDIVTINWTLENTSDCIGFLKKARKFLKPDGHLVVATGSRILVPYKKPLSKYFSANPADTHCFRFSVKSLIRALLLAGCEYTFGNKQNFSDSDWLIVCGVGESDKVPNDSFFDDPQEVIRFFDDWAKMFPWAVIPESTTLPSYVARALGDL